jgi:hypothetical protein
MQIRVVKRSGGAGIREMKSGQVNGLNAGRCGRALEVCGEAEGEAARRADGVAGEESGEVEEVEGIGEVFAVCLEGSGETFGMMQCCSGGGIEECGREDATAIEVEAGEDLRAVLGKYGVG